MAMRGSVRRRSSLRPKPSEVVKPTVPASRSRNPIGATAVTTAPRAGVTYAIAHVRSPPRTSSTSSGHTGPSSRTPASGVELPAWAAGVGGRARTRDAPDRLDGGIAFVEHATALLQHPVALVGHPLVLLGRPRDLLEPGRRRRPRGPARHRRGWLDRRTAVLRRREALERLVGEPDQRFAHRAGVLEQLAPVPPHVVGVLVDAPQPRLGLAPHLLGLAVGLLDPRIGLGARPARDL